MRRRLNFPCLVKTLAILLALGVSAHFLHAVQVRRSAETFLKRANEAVANGDYEPALPYFQNYLAIRPDDVAARAAYALALDHYARTPGARGHASSEMEKVLAAEPERAPLRYRYAVLLIEAGRVDDALPQVEKLVAAGYRPEPPAPLPQHILGWCLEAKKRYADAAKAFASAVEVDPTRIATYELWVQTLLELPPEDAANPAEPEEKARAVLDRMVAANPKDAAAFLARFRFLERHGQPDEAKKDLDEAERLAPKAPGVFLARAGWQFDHGDLAAANATLAAGYREHPKNAGIVKALAGAQMRAGRTAEAIPLLREAVDRIFAPDLNVLLIELLIDNRELDEANSRLAILSADGSAPLLSLYLKGRLAAEQGRWTEAAALLERVRADLTPTSDWQGRLHALLGLCYANLGDVEGELVSFRRATEREPGWPQARLGLAAALAHSGRLDEASRLLEDLIRDQEKTAARLQGLDLLLARVLLGQTLRRPENDRDWSPVTEALERARKNEPKSLEPILLEAEMLAARDKTAEAEALLEQARTTHPTFVPFRTLAADLAARQNRLADAARLLDEAEKALGAQTVLDLARLQLWARGGAVDGDAAVADLKRRAASRPAPERGRLLAALAATMSRLGASKIAEGLWREVAELEPRDVRSRAALLDLALAAKDEPAARRWIEGLRDLEGDDGMWWRAGVAALLIEAGKRQPAKLVDARAALDRLAVSHRDWHRLALLRACLAEARGAGADALGHYQDAVRLGERSPDVIRFLVVSLLEHKRFLDADAVVSLLEEQGPLAPELARLGVDAAFGLPNHDKARRRALIPANLDAKDHRVQTWLAGVYHRLGDDEQAEAAARRAVALHPGTPDTWIALVRTLALRGKRDEAAALIDEAIAKVPSVAASYLSARCREALGDLAQAEAIFLAGVKDQAGEFNLAMQAIDFFERTDQFAKALPVLRHLLSAEASTPREFLPRLRRQMALALAEDPGGREEAIAVLNRNGKPGAEDPVNQRARAMVLGMDPKKHDEAAKLFSDASKRTPPDDDELYRLARIHERGGHTAEATEILEKLVLYQPENPRYLARLALLLAGQGRETEGRDYLTRLERLEPASARTAQVRAALKSA
ncbi:MAG: tetratricopeptide repeat protein [Gemmataceae bacterium]